MWVVVGLKRGHLDLHDSGNILQYADGRFEENYEILQPKQQTNNRYFNQALAAQSARAAISRSDTHSLSQRSLFPSDIPSQFTKRKSRSMVGKMLFGSDVTIGLRVKQYVLACFEVLLENSLDIHSFRSLSSERPTSSSTASSSQSAV